MVAYGDSPTYAKRGGKRAFSSMTQRDATTKLEDFEKQHKHKLTKLKILTTHRVGVRRGYETSSSQSNNSSSEAISLDRTTGHYTVNESTRDHIKRERSLEKIHTFDLKNQFRRVSISREEPEIESISVKGPRGSSAMPTPKAAGSLLVLENPSTPSTEKNEKKGRPTYYVEE